MMLNTKGRYAVMAMVDMAMQPQGAPVRLAEISARQEITLPYLEQIFSALKKAGLVRAQRGPGGGYLFVKPTSETRVADIITAVDEPIKMTRCNDHKAGCMSKNAKCLTHDLWDGLGRQIYGYLDRITLQDICERNIDAEPLRRAG